MYQKLAALGAVRGLYMFIYTYTPFFIACRQLLALMVLADSARFLHFGALVLQSESPRMIQSCKHRLASVLLDILARGRYPLPNALLSIYVWPCLSLSWHSRRQNLHAPLGQLHAWMEKGYVHWSVWCPVQKRNLGETCHPLWPRTLMLAASVCVYVWKLKRHAGGTKRSKLV